MSSVFYSGESLSAKPNPKLVNNDMRDYYEIWPGQWTASLDLIPDSYPHKAMIRGYCADLHLHRPNGFGLILYGPTGRGKTALATIVLRNVIARGGNVVCKTAAEIIDTLENFNPEKFLLQNGATVECGLREADFVLVDEFLGSRHKDTSKLGGLIKHRVNCNRPTIITTQIRGANLRSVDFLKDHLSSAGKFIGVEVTGHDWRNPVQGSK